MKNEWIPVTEKTPPENVPVWCMAANHQGPIMMVYCWIDGGGFDDSGWVWANCYDLPTYHNGEWLDDSAEYDDQYHVSHWMPLPEPIPKRKR